MKKLIIFSLLIALGVTVNAQNQLRSFDNDTIKGDTNTYVSNKKIPEYKDILVAFAFTKSDVTDSLSVAKMQGSFDNSTFVDLTDTNASLTTTTTDGTTVLYVTDPIYLYYRGFLAAATGDTVAITDAKFIIKKD